VEEETARRVTEHDFLQGPWWPSGSTVDAVWAVEFLEHVGRHYLRNYFPLLTKAAVLILTHLPEEAGTTWRCTPTHGGGAGWKDAALCTVKN